MCHSAAAWGYYGYDPSGLRSAKLPTNPSILVYFPDIRTFGHLDISYQNCVWTLSQYWSSIVSSLRMVSGWYDRSSAVAAVSRTPANLRLVLVDRPNYVHIWTNTNMYKYISHLSPSTSAHVDLSPSTSTYVDLSPCRSQPIDFSPWQQIVSWILNRYLDVWWSQVGRCTCHGWVYGHGWCPDRLDVVCHSVWHAWWSLAICSQFFNYQCQIMSMSPQYD